MTIFLSLLIAIIGVLMYALCINPKLQEIGRLAFFSGMLAFLLRIGPDTISLITR
jgi:Na+/phosphate symporter